MYEAEKRARRYDRLYGQRLLRPLAAQFLKGLPISSGQVWLDWESGAGTLSTELLASLPADSTVVSVDGDRATLRVFHSHPEFERDGRCFIRQEPADELGLADGVVDVACGHWRWQFLDHPGPAVKELCRVVKPAGLVVLSFLVPGSSGSLFDAFEKSGAHDIAEAMQTDGMSTSTVRELLRGGNVAQIEVRTVSHQLIIGASSRPMMDPLLLDFLLPRWMTRASGQEVTNVENAPFDLGSEPLSWEFKMGIAVATLAQVDLVASEETEQSPVAGAPVES